MIRHSASVRLLVWQRARRAHTQISIHWPAHCCRCRWWLSPRSQCDCYSCISFGIEANVKKAQNHLCISVGIVVNGCFRWAEADISLNCDCWTPTDNSGSENGTDRYPFEGDRVGTVWVFFRRRATVTSLQDHGRKTKYGKWKYLRRVQSHWVCW